MNAKDKETVRRLLASIGAVPHNYSQPASPAASTAKRPPGTLAATPPALRRRGLFVEDQQ
jgi:hypothetical protein